MSENGLISREARTFAGRGEWAAPSSGDCFIRISVGGQDALSRAENLLAGIPGGLDKAIKSAMARSLSHLRTSSTKEIRKVYAISAAALRAEENIKTKYTYQPGQGISGYVLFSGKRIPLYRYDGSSPVQPTKDTSKKYGVVTGENASGEGIWKFLYPGVAAAGHVLKSTSPYRFDSAFVARMRNGHVGIFERTGGMTSNSKDELEELFGPSVPQMVGNEAVQQALVEEAMKKFDERLSHEVDVILAGLR